MYDGRFDRTYLGDDLVFKPHEYEGAGGVERIADFVRRTPDIPFNTINIAFIMYNLGKYDYQDFVVFEELERHLHKHKGIFTARQSFGCLYGLYRSNSGSTFGIEFFEEELLKQISFIDINYAYELIMGATYHKQLSKERIYSYLSENIVPIMLDQWGRLYHRKNKRLELMERLIIGEYFDEKLWNQMLKTFRTGPNTRGLPTLTYLIDSLKKLNKSGKFFRDLQPDINCFLNKIRKNPDYAWLYNVEEERYFTYAEVLKKRNEYNYPEQMNFPDTEEDIKEMMEAENSEFDDFTTETLAKKQLKKDFDEFNDIILEKLSKGESASLEDVKLTLSQEELKGIATEYIEEGDEHDDAINEQQKSAQQKALKDKLKKEKAIRKKEFKGAGKQQSESGLPSDL